MEVAIIGAGVAGVTAIKSCLEEGLTPVCYERTGHIGGLWRFTEEVHEGQGCVTRSTVANTAKEMMSFSDFPMPADTPNYPRHQHVYQYLQLYAAHFHLEKYIDLNTEVIKVSEADDYVTSGRWSVTTRNVMTSHVTTRIFDAVLVCNGHLSVPKIPNFSGLSDFQGYTMHSQAFKDERNFAGQTVVVVGMANSACDMAVDVSRIAAQVYISTKSGAYVIDRCATFGMPLVYYANKRIAGLARWLLPSISAKVFEKIHDDRNGIFFNSFKPSHPFTGEHVTVNDEFHSRVHCGAIIVKDNIKTCTTSGVVFQDGSEVKNVDAILFGTGYDITYPFLDHDVIDQTTGGLLLYKSTFSTDMPHPTLAFVGLMSTTGSTIPLMELQSRWAVRVFTKATRLPLKEEMVKSVVKEQEIRSRIFTDPRAKNLHVEWMDMIDSLATEVGCKPNLWYLLISDPKLWIKCCFDMCSPYQNRLMGPHPWPGAREAIMTQWDRINRTFRTRSRGTVQTAGQRGIAGLCGIYPVIVLILLATTIAYLWRYKE